MSLMYSQRYNTIGNTCMFQLAKQAAASKAMHVGKLLASKGISRRPCRPRGQHLARFVRRRRRGGGHFFFGWDAFSCHGVLHPRHGPQASPCFLEWRVRRRLSPPRVAFSALHGSFFSLICYVFAQCSASFCRTLDSVILLSLLPFCYLSFFPCPCSCCSC
jgi:hypothetical protein